MIVELEGGVWLSSGNGDPPRTLIEKNALDFKFIANARIALSNARKYKRFKDAKIVNKRK